MFFLKFKQRKYDAMAKFELEIPKEILDQMNTIYDKCDEIFGGMTKAGAEVVVKNVKAKAPLPEIANSVKTSVVYKTPSDGGINTKVYFSGYIPFKGNRISATAISWIIRKSMTWHATSKSSASRAGNMSIQHSMDGTI